MQCSPEFCRCGFSFGLASLLKDLLLGRGQEWGQGPRKLRSRGYESALVGGGGAGPCRLLTVCLGPWTDVPDGAAAFGRWSHGWAVVGMVERSRERLHAVLGTQCSSQVGA